MVKDPLFLWNNVVYIKHIHTYCTLKVYGILKMCVFSSFQNFSISIIILILIMRTFYWKNTVNAVKILKILSKCWKRILNITKLLKFFWKINNHAEGDYLVLKVLKLNLVLSVLKLLKLLFALFYIIIHLFYILF